MKVKFAIADNNPMRRDGMRAILEEENFEVSHAVDHPDALEKQLKEVDILIWLTDAQFPISNPLIKKFHMVAPQTKIMVCDHDNGLSPAIQAIGAGANAYLTAGAQREEFLFAIDNVLKGRNYIDPVLTVKLFHKLSDFEGQISSIHTEHEISAQEREILDLMICGLVNKEIANHLHTTRRNIENLRQNLITKTGAKDNLSLILYRLHKEFIRS